MATKKRKASKKPLRPKKSVKAALKTKPVKAKTKSKPKAKVPAPAAPPPSSPTPEVLVNLPVEVHGGGLPESFEAVLTAKGAETVIAKLKESPQ